jgi:uncharacterized protein (TIGR04255 family)
MPLIRPQVPRAIFRSSPLTLVAGQVQFEPILAISESSFIASFQEAIRASYPRVGRVSSVEMAVGPDGVEARPKSTNGWAFSSPDENATIGLDANSLALELRSYRTYEDFRAQFAQVLTTFLALVDVGERTRVGLRYVNHIRHDSPANIASWRDLVRPELLGLAASSDLAADEYVMHSISETRYAEEESQLIVRYGYVHLPSVAGPTGISTAPAFLLDLDHFDVRRTPTIDADQVMNQLDYFHKDIHRVFRWAITDAGATALGIGEEIDDEGTRS